MQVTSSRPPSSLPDVRRGSPPASASKGFLRVGIWQRCGNKKGLLTLRRVSSMPHLGSIHPEALPGCLTEEV